MADSPLDSRPTVFPRFDTLATPARRERNGKRQCGRRAFYYATNPVARPKSRDALLQSYTQFITSYTGESEVTFQYALRTRLEKPLESQIIQAKILNGQTVSEIEQTDDCVLGVFQPHEDGTEAFDFGLEILADVDNFNSAKAPTLLDCPFLVQYHAMEMTLTMIYDRKLMDNDYADAAFKMLVNHISRTKVYADHETRPSVLNHPPLMRSPLLGDEALPSLLHSGFPRTVKEHPGRHALDYRSETTQFTLTYGQLDALTTKLAHKLRSNIPHASHQTQTIVPVYMTASPAFYVSWLAVLKAGFAFCPLPVNAPAIELQNIVEDVCAALVLTDGPMVCGCPWDAWYCDDDELSACLDVNDFILNWMRTPYVADDRPLPGIAETDLAYVMYSSGSSGVPKGFKITHLAANYAISSHCKQIPAYMSKRGFRWLQSAPPVSDTSTMEIFTTWSTGGTLCSVPSTYLLNMTTAINKVSATITSATAKMASTLQPTKTPSLRQLWCIGNSFTPSLIERLEQQSSYTPYTALTLLRTYSTPGCSISSTILPALSSTTRDTIIGKPFPTTTILLLNPRTKTPVPLGCAGDLYISGPQLSSGFLNRPDLDAEYFLHSGVYGRLCKTGDRARIVKDTKGEFVVEVLRGVGVKQQVVESEDSSVDGNSVTSMVDSFTETVVAKEEKKEIDVTEANVLSLINKMYR
ncbi:acetyl-CoA synthetase-like protein [Aureobasidium pullulans]|uniref:Acetyl-CoA synthetase-like protein n=1 Tax=Aureobasidium pullulans TaxID=5580 RepID=A0A4S9TEM9_AURPU|nr:acetyl-CoA synthetase-like protein [Aureobasidium pullulans]